ncbi:hypothetical protein J437_LFUL013262 [Ladona fulva]|uniref:Chitin-binding type-2 domain-containing protein n=1 Tax=Ladona fulva TaxID=123851 RepID=A0A8K0P5N8_LADFU|nr:hypothetical protein J437_LFUL013262 [Ladona fulva]
MKSAVLCAYDTPKPTPSDWFECPADGYYPDPYNCHIYFVCVSENAWEFHCPAHLYYNPVKRVSRVVPFRSKRCRNHLPNDGT